MTATKCNNLAVPCNKMMVKNRINELGCGIGHVANPSEKKIMGTYISIRFSKAVGERFRAFSQNMAPSHSKALKILLDAHALMEQGKTPNKSKSVEVLLKSSDTNADRVIAILRKIEKDQLKPMLGMLQVLFGYSSQQEDASPKKGRGKSAPKKTESEFKREFAFLDLKDEKLQLAAELDGIRQDILDLLKNKTEVVKPTFGKPFVKLLVTPGELEQLIQQYAPQP